MTIGKDYKPNRSIEGAALFVLTLERSGARRIGGADDIVKATLRDLGVTAEELETYISTNRAALEAELDRRTR